MPAKRKETISDQDGSIVIPIAFAVARYGGKLPTDKEDRKGDRKISIGDERGGGITRTELAIIDAVLHKIQSLVKKRIDMRNKGETDRQLLLPFEEEAGMITDSSQSQVTEVGGYEFRFPLRELGISPRHYQEAFDTVMKMGDINVEWEFDDKEHGRSTTKRQLFQPTAFGAVKRWNDPDSHRNGKGEVMRVPENAPNHLFHWEYTGKPTVGISISPIVANRFFDPSRYGRYLDITLDFKCKYSIRLYWFLALYWRRGFTTFDFSWTALRTTLGIDQSSDGGKNVIQELSDKNTVRVNAPDEQNIVMGVYPKLSLFITRVLNPIKQDFLRMAPHPAKEGEPNAPLPRVEYNLSYEVVKKQVSFNNTRKEMPDRIIFTLNVSSLGRQIQEGQDINEQQRRIINKLTDELCQQEMTAHEYTRITLGQLQQLEEKVDYIISGIKSRKPEWSVCQTLDKLDTEREKDLLRATTDTRRKNIQKRYVTDTHSAIQGFAKRALDNFCTNELSKISMSEEVTEVATTDASQGMEKWG